MLPGTRHEARAAGSRQAWYTAVRGALILFETCVLASAKPGSKLAPLWLKARECRA